MDQPDNSVADPNLFTVEPDPTFKKIEDPYLKPLCEKQIEMRPMRECIPDQSSQEFKDLDPKFQKKLRLPLE